MLQWVARRGDQDSQPDAPKRLAWAVEMIPGRILTSQPNGNRGYGTSGRMAPTGARRLSQRPRVQDPAGGRQRRVSGAERNWRVGARNFA